MRRPKRNTSLSLPILAALLALLLLAALQVYWATQMSASERERMQATLDAAALRFGEDFDRELARIYLSLQLDAATLRDGDWARYALRYDHWEAEAPHPALVDSVYLVTAEADATLRLLRYDPLARSFVPVPWPPQLAEARRVIAESYRNSYVARGVLVSNSPPPLVDSPPALIIPAARTWLLSDQQQLDFEARFLFGDTVIAPAEGACLSCEPVKGGLPLFAHTIVMLDEVYLGATFIPALAERTLASSAPDYSLEITSRSAPERVRFRTGPTPAHNDPADASAWLFRVRIDELNRFLLDDALRGGEARPSRRSPVAVGLVTARGAQGGEELWRLNVTHRAGSIARAAEELRARNLALSLGSLLLLAGSFVLMTVLARRAQRLAQQKIDFVTVVSHELRTPLAVICAAGENLADGVVQEAERARQYGAVICGEGRRLSEMVEQVLAFAEIQSGGKSYTLVATDVGGVVARAVADCRLQAEALGGMVELRIEPELPPVAADAAALGNAVQNLVANGLKYGGERPLVQVRVAPGHGLRGPEVHVCVADSGIGIAPEDVPHIFEPFYRSHEVIAAQIGGSGLGLGFVRHIAQAHGGSISVESTLGRGSTFTLRLPAIRAGAPYVQAHSADRR
jgi:signal transduction histidine kinase